jgi:hypothetical protein
LADFVRIFQVHPQIKGVGKDVNLKCCANLSSALKELTEEETNKNKLNLP